MRSWTDPLRQWTVVLAVVLILLLCVMTWILCALLRWPWQVSLGLQIVSQALVAAFYIHIIVMSLEGRLNLIRMRNIRSVCGKFQRWSTLVVLLACTVSWVLTGLTDQKSFASLSWITMSLVVCAACIIRGYVTQVFIALVRARHMRRTELNAENLLYGEMKKRNPEGDSVVDTHWINEIYREKETGNTETGNYDVLKQLYCHRNAAVFSLLLFATMTIFSSTWFFTGMPSYMESIWGNYDPALDLMCYFLMIATLYVQLFFFWKCSNSMCCVLSLTVVCFRVFNRQSSPQTRPVRKTKYDLLVMRFAEFKRALHDNIPWTEGAGPAWFQQIELAILGCKIVSLECKRACE